MIRIQCDTHSHTIFSRHAFSTIQENVHAASLARLELLGSTDHFSSLVGHEVDIPRAKGYDLRDFQHFLNYPAWPPSWEGVRVLHGCETDIEDLDGHIFGHTTRVMHAINGEKRAASQSLEDMVTKQCDYVLASLHNLDITRNASVSQVTEMYMRVLDHPRVLILGHVGRYGVPFDIPALCAYAKEKGKLLEINEATLASYPRDVCKKLCLCCAETQTMITTGSDAHISMEVGRFPLVHELLEEIHFPQKLIASTDAETFMQVLRKAIPESTCS